MTNVSNPFKRVVCRCTACGGVWKIPRRRIVRVEMFFDVKKGQPFVWECHDCHVGVVVPGRFPNSHGETITLDPHNLPSNTVVLRF